MAKTKTTTPTPKMSRPNTSPELAKVAIHGGRGVRPAPSTATKYSTPLPKRK